MADAELVLGRLRDPEGPLRALVGLLLDDVLGRPARELVDPAWLAGALVQGIRSSADDPRTTAWIRGRVQALRARTGGLEGPLRGRVPGELVRPVQELLRRPYSPDPALVRPILDHAALRELIREMLFTTVMEYARRVRVPDGAMDALRAGPLGRGRLAQLAGAASVAARVVGGEVERQLEPRIREFVDGAIVRALDVAVDFFCAPSRAEVLGAWRADSVDVALGLPVELWLGELDRLDPEGLVEDLSGLVRALAHADALRAQLESAIRAALDQGGGLSAREFLAGSGLEEGWRPQAEELMLQRARDLVQTPAFESWLRGVLG